MSTLLRAAEYTYGVIEPSLRRLGPAAPPLLSNQQSCISLIKPPRSASPTRAQRIVPVSKISLTRPAPAGGQPSATPRAASACCFAAAASALAASASRRAESELPLEQRDRVVAPLPTVETSSSGSPTRRPPLHRVEVGAGRAASSVPRRGRGRQALALRPARLPRPAPHLVAGARLAAAQHVRRRGRLPRPRRKERRRAATA